MFIRHSEHILLLRVLLELPDYGLSPNSRLHFEHFAQWLQVLLVDQFECFIRGDFGRIEC